MPSTDDEPSEQESQADLRSVIIDIHNAVTEMNKKITGFEKRISSLEEELDESRNELKVLSISVFKTLPDAGETRTLHRELSREQASEDEEIAELTPDMMKRIRRASKRR